MATFEERLAALEKAAAEAWLPPSLVALQRKLEATWLPEAGVLLQAGSITEELLPWKIVRGVVDATSGTPSITAGTGFTITDNGVGDYTINFTPAFGSVPAVVPTAHSGAAGTAAAKLSNGTAVTSSAARLAVYRTDTGAQIDVSFHFIAIAPR